jgi:hypothetical protein
LLFVFGQAGSSTCKQDALHIYHFIKTKATAGQV